MFKRFPKVFFFNKFLEKPKQVSNIHEFVLRPGFQTSPRKKEIGDEVVCYRNSHTLKIGINVTRKGDGN